MYAHGMVGDRGVLLINSLHHNAFVNVNADRKISLKETMGVMFNFYFKDERKQSLIEKTMTEGLAILEKQRNDDITKAR